jgi:rare lipoprotein A
MWRVRSFAVVSTLLVLCPVIPKAGETSVGIASFYGARHEGRRTASGEIFDRHQLTAAHRTLAMGAIIDVLNLENGRRATLRINDRGPFRRGRVLDVSERAAQELDFVHKGTARIRIDRR